VAADAGGFTIEQLQELFRIFTQAEDAVRSSQHPRFVLEAAAVRATRLAGAGGQGRAAAAAVPPQAAPRPPSSPRQADPRAAPEAPIALEWERVVERVTGEHPNIGAFLEQGRLVKIEGNEVIVGYPKSAALAFGRMQKEDNQRAVMRTCEELAGRPVRLRVVELAEGQRVPPSPAEARAAKEQDRKRALLDEARSHPVVKQAMAVFGAEVTEVRRAAAPKESE
jgi:DNA polymerase-3 subunit gamma/tau